MTEAPATTVPLIDIQKVKLMTPSERGEQGIIVRAGFRSPGFVQGIEDPAFTALVHDATSRLMNREFDELLTYYDERLVGVRGYTPLFSETALKEGSLPDLKDFFDVPIFDVGPPMLLPADVREIILLVREGVKSRAMAMLRLLALGHGLSENFFVDLIEYSEHSILRFLRYPSIDDTASILAHVITSDTIPNQIARLGTAFLLKVGINPGLAHTLDQGELHETLCVFVERAQRSQEHMDMGFLTLLIAGDANGLYINLPDGTRVPVSTAADLATFNSGDMAVEYTKHHHPDDPMSSTQHGVENSKDRSKRRGAMAAFFHLRREVRLSPEYTAGEFHDYRTGKTIAV